MTITFFDKLIYRVRGRLPLVTAKLETMLVYTRSTGDPTPELALSRTAEPAGPPGAPTSPAAASPGPEEGGKGGRGGGSGGAPQGGGAEGAGGGGDAGPGPIPGDLPPAAHARPMSPRRSTEAAPQPTLQITIGKLELHAAPPARAPDPVPRQRSGLPLSDYLDRRR